MWNDIPFGILGANCELFMARENETKFFYIEMKICLRKLGQSSRQKDLNIHGKKKRNHKLKEKDKYPYFILVKINFSILFIGWFDGQLWILTHSISYQKSNEIQSKYVT